MAFDANISPLNTFAQTGGGEGIRFFSYRTDDLSATVMATGYFAKCERYGVRLGDLIFVTPLTSASLESYIAVVSLIDASGNVTVAAVIASPGLPPSNGTNDEATLLAALLQGPVDGRFRTYFISGGFDISSVTNPRLSNITLKQIADPPPASSRLIYFDGNHTNSLYLDHVIFDRGTNYNYINAAEVSNAGALWCVEAKLAEVIDCEVYGGGSGKGFFFSSCDRVRCVRPHIHDIRVDWNGTGAVPEEQIEGIRFGGCTNVLCSGHNIHRMLYKVQWAPGQIYLDPGIRVWYGANSYKTTIGTTGAVPPTHTSGAVTAADGITYTYTGVAANAAAAQQTRGVSISNSSNVLVEHGITTFTGQSVDCSGGGSSRNIILAHNIYEDSESYGEAFKHQLYGAKSIGATVVRAGLYGITTSGDPAPEQMQSIGIYDYTILDTGGVNPVDGVSGGNWGATNILAGIGIIGAGNATSVTIGDGRIDDLQMEPCTFSIGTPGVVTKAAHGKTVGLPVRFNTTATMPATSPASGLLALQRYWVVSVPDADTFTVSATKGGTAINTTSTGSGISCSMPTTEHLLRVENTTLGARVRVGQVGGQIWKSTKFNGSNFDLSDAEEFTFTPILTSATAVTGQVYTIQYGTGVRRGNIVEFEVALVLSNLGSGGTGDMVIDLNDFRWLFPSVVSNKPLISNCVVRSQGLDFSAGYSVAFATPIQDTRTMKIQQTGDNIVASFLQWSQLVLIGGSASINFNGRARISIIE